MVRDLRAGAGAAIYLCGGGELAAQLFAADLVDEVILKINPLVMGPGIPLFGAAVPTRDLVLRDARIYGSGVVVASYRVAKR